jgi:hypothetical protein
MPKTRGSNQKTEFRISDCGLRIFQLKTGDVGCEMWDVRYEREDCRLMNESFQVSGVRGEK